jgi:hypothetical protein
LLRHFFPTICRQIVERHGGIVELMDHHGPGRHSRFACQLRRWRDAVVDDDVREAMANVLKHLWSLNWAKDDDGNNCPMDLRFTESANRPIGQSPLCAVRGSAR